jgi:CRISPR-associated protein Csy1
LYSPIIDFFEKRKLKTLEDCKTFEEKVAAVKLHLKTWLAESAVKVGQMKISTHPCTFVHPSANKNKILMSQSNAKGKVKVTTKEVKTTPTIANMQHSNDGFLRSGNVENVEADALGNAAVLGYYNFLNIVLPDGKTILWHIDNETPEAKNLLANVDNIEYESLRNGLLAVKNYEGALSTSSKLKQVYFPVNGDYHLLSVLMPSGIMFEMRKRIHQMKFSEETKALKEARKNNEYSEGSFRDIADLTLIGFGGTKPQNISVLNNANGGKAYYLPSLPPALSDYKVKLPRKNFFAEVLWPGFYKEDLSALHKLFKADINNINIRQGRDNRILNIFDDIVKKIWAIRSSEIGWSEKERCVGLPVYQKIILDDLYRPTRAESEAELSEFLTDIARWIIIAYQKVAGTDAIKLSDDELIYIKKLIESQIEVLS